MCRPPNLRSRSSPARSLLPERKRGDRGQALAQQAPMLAVVKRTKQAAVIGTEHDLGAVGGEAASIDVVLEPGQPTVTPYERRVALERLAVQRRAASPGAS